MTYCINNWDSNFEKADNRKCKEMKWVAVPTDYSDKHFRKLTRLKNGAEIFGISIVILEIAAKMPKRGVLADSDGDLTPEDMELMTGFPSKLFKNAISVLSSDGIRWLSGSHPDGIRTTGQDRTGHNKTGHKQKFDWEEWLTIPDNRNPYPHLNDPKFYSLFEERMRNQKVTKTERAMKAALEKLQAVDLESAKSALLDAIDGGYQGVFPKQQKINGQRYGRQDVSLEEAMENVNRAFE